LKNVGRSFDRNNSETDEGKKQAKLHKQQAGANECKKQWKRKKTIAERWLVE
jgi:hypothetical protein